MSAVTAVRVVTERKQGWLTMADLRVFISVWGEAVGSMVAQADHDAAMAVEPVVIIEGQAGRISRITADLPQPTP